MSYRNLRLAICFSPFAILLLVCVGSVSAATYDVGVGQTYATIADAIAAAGDGTGDIINVVDAVHTEPNIVVSKSLTIQGQGMDATIVQANADVNLASSRVFTVEASKTVTIRDMTIRHGRVVGGLLLVAEEALGGGIKNSGALTLRNVRVTANRVQVNALTGPTPGFAGRGGGIYNDGTMEVVDCEITNNEAKGEPSEGGGIFSTVDIAILRTLVSGNSALPGYDDAHGGGIFNEGELTVTDSALSSNTALGRDSSGLSPHDAPSSGWGGAIFNSGVADVTNSTFQSNMAQGGYGAQRPAGDALGGGIYNGGDLTVVDTTLDDNEAIGGNGSAPPFGDAEPGSAYGGGIVNQADANVAVLRSTLSNNSVVNGVGDGGELGLSRGGGAADSGAVSSAEIMTFTNSTISGNSAGEGGGIFGYQGIELTSCTVADNSADLGGGLNSGTDTDDTGPILANTIVGDNTATSDGPDIHQRVQSRGYNLIEDPNGGAIDISGGGNTDTGNILGQDPLLGPLADNGGPTYTHALLEGSPALDQIPVGTNGMGTDPLDEDQRGVSRPQRTEGDIGAFELVQPVLPVGVDIKPGSCPNPLNRKSKGVLPVAIVGTDDLDVLMIDADSIMLMRAGIDDGVAPLRTNVEDVATPFEGEPCGCHEMGADGVLDLTMKFDTPEIVEALQLDSLSGGDEVLLTITGTLQDGTEFEGSDCIRLVPPHDKGHGPPEPNEPNAPGDPNASGDPNDPGDPNSARGLGFGEGLVHRCGAGTAPMLPMMLGVLGSFVVLRRKR